MPLIVNVPESSSVHVRLSPQVPLSTTLISEIPGSAAVSAVSSGTAVSAASVSSGAAVSAAVSDSSGTGVSAVPAVSGSGSAVCGSLSAVLSSGTAVTVSSSGSVSFGTSVSVTSTAVSAPSPSAVSGAANAAGIAAVSIESEMIILKIFLRSVYKELHADRETGC